MADENVAAVVADVLLWFIRSTGDNLLHAILGLVRRVLGRPTLPLQSGAVARTEASVNPVVSIPPAPVADANQKELAPSLSAERPPPELRSTEWKLGKPFKAGKMPMDEWKSKGREIQKYPWRYEYGNELFRSPTEVEWAKAFDKLGLSWESEPVKFDMGSKYVSYTPDFRVPGLSIPGSHRRLFIEVKQFPDVIDLTKYVRFTEWYNCDLLVLAHVKGGVLKQKKERYFLVSRCRHCGTHDCLGDALPTKDYQPPIAPPVCQDCQGPLDRMVVPNYFCIQAGAVGTRRVVLESHPRSGPRLSFQ